MKKAPHKNIFLIGPMGAGKSSVGKTLAAQLAMDFYDSDEELEKLTGVDIGWIFDLEGEEGFRVREEMVIDKLTRYQNIVLATGGGSVISPANQAALANNGLVIFLDVSLEFQNARTVNESRRPLLRVHNREEVIERLYAERNPIYQRLADHRILTDQRSVRAVVDDIMQWLEGQQRG